MNAGLDEDLVHWADSFMRDRRVVPSVNGQQGGDGGYHWAPSGLPGVAGSIRPVHRRDLVGGRELGGGQQKYLLRRRHCLASGGN